MSSRPADGAHEGMAPVMAPHANLSEIVPTLPLETRCPPFRLRQYSGFWLPEVTLQEGIPAIHACFEPRPTDVFLASFPKSGTTWLKALAFATLNRATHSPLDIGHPLRHRNPHDCVRCLDVYFSIQKNTGNLMDEFEALPSPRVLATHIPYSLLPHRIKEEGSGCRIVYICRDPKDALISSWLFTKKGSRLEADVADTQSFTLQEAFELFSEGISVSGPQWQHVLEYWEESLRRPDKVLFLRYEDMLLDPKSNLKKLSMFIGHEFSKQEDEAGVVDAIVELCSLDKLKNMEVNKNGSTFTIKNETFFRNGVAGDWRNHMTPEMAQKLDKIVEDALQGSGFTFANSA